MLLGKAVSEDRVKIDLKARDKESAVRELVSLVCETEPDCEEIVSAVMERQSLFLMRGFARFGRPLSVSEFLIKELILILRPESCRGLLY